MAAMQLVTLLVEDYDSAIDFFVRQLEFELIEDSHAVAEDGRAKQWVVVRPPGAQTGILLARAVGESQFAAVDRQCGDRVGFFLEVEAFDISYERMVNAGVRFSAPPRVEPYGKVAVFHDIAGNRWDLICHA